MRKSILYLLIGVLTASFISCKSIDTTNVENNKVNYTISTEDGYDFITVDNTQVTVYQLLREMRYLSYDFYFDLSTPELHTIIDSDQVENIRTEIDNKIEARFTKLVEGSNKQNELISLINQAIRRRLAYSIMSDQNSDEIEEAKYINDNEFVFTTQLSGIDIKSLVEYGNFRLELLKGEVDIPTEEGEYTEFVVEKGIIDELNSEDIVHMHTEDNVKLRMVSENGKWKFDDESLNTFIDSVIYYKE